MLFLLYGGCISHFSSAALGKRPLFVFFYFLMFIYVCIIFSPGAACSSSTLSWNYYIMYLPHFELLQRDWNKLNGRRMAGSRLTNMSKERCAVNGHSYCCLVYIRTCCCNLFILFIAYQLLLFLWWVIFPMYICVCISK